MNKEKNLDGIKGWLILVAIGVVMTPIINTISFFERSQQLFLSGGWEALTTQGNETYNALWAPILSVELLINCCYILAWLYIVYMFFSKSKNFPKWFIRITIFTVVFCVGDAIAVNMILPNEPLFDPDSAKELARSVLIFFIWVPYMMVSKRVGATFKR
jgi:hypothetical protein